MSTTLTEIYDRMAGDGDLVRDPAQIAALSRLDHLRARLEAQPAPRRGLLNGLLRRPRADAPAGLYLWGGVGRGKSMLMDLFVRHLDIAEKRRVHFHAFMQDIHAALHKARQDGAEDALAPVADQTARSLRLLALDEMQITDITDAMIVGRLFEALFQAGVVVVATSNRAPDDLYKNGLNRQLFLPFIDTLRRNMTVHELAGPGDYRQGRLAGAQVYFTPITAEARAGVARIWDSLTGGRAESLTLMVQGRRVVLSAFWGGAARAGFFDLCGRALGPADYLALAGAVRVLILEDIPQLGRSNYNEARRFVTLVDALYEARVRLICSAAAPPEMLYVEGEGRFEFDRTASRLREMQDAGWG